MIIKVNKYRPNIGFLDMNHTATNVFAWYKIKMIKFYWRSTAMRVANVGNTKVNQPSM